MKRLATGRPAVGNATGKGGTRRLPALAWLAVGFSIALLPATLRIESARAARNSWRSITPNGRTLETVCVRVGETQSEYCLLDARTPIQFSLRGPSKLRVLTRHLPQNGQTGKRCYTIRIEQDGTPVTSRPHLAAESKTAHLCDRQGTPAGASCETIVTIPDGRHDYRVFVEEAGKAVAARFFRSYKAAGTRYAEFAPREYERICTLATPDGKQYQHYRFTAEKPLRFTVNGPISLLLRTRLDFREGEDAEAAYGLALARRPEAGGPWEPAGTVNFSAKPEAQARYQDCHGVVPGESRRADLEIPAGSWTYELRPLETGGRNVTARVLIPRSAIGLGS